MSNVFLCTAQGNEANHHCWHEVTVRDNVTIKVCCFCCEGTAYTTIRTDGSPPHGKYLPHGTLGFWPKASATPNKDSA